MAQYCRDAAVVGCFIFCLLIDLCFSAGIRLSGLRYILKHKSSEGIVVPVEGRIGVVSGFPYFQCSSECKLNYFGDRNFTVFHTSVTHGPVKKTAGG